jgi:hypothetical protein
MPTLDAYYAAKQRRDEARGDVRAISKRLRHLAERLDAPVGVALNESITTRGPAANYITIDQSDLPDWSRLSAAIRAFVEADSAFREADAGLTPEQRRDIGAPR